MDLLTLKEMIEYLTKDMSEEQMKNTPVFMGDDEEVNGIHDSYGVELTTKGDLKCNYDIFVEQYPDSTKILLIY